MYLKMQTSIVFVLLFSLRTMSLAADVTVYNHADYFLDFKQAPVAVSQFPWKFGYYGSDVFSMYILTINKSARVTAIDATCTIDSKTTEFKTHHVRRKGQEYYVIDLFGIEWHTEIIQIKLNLYKSNISCESLLVAEGRRANVEDLYDHLHKDFPHYSRLNNACVLEVDLRNKCVSSIFHTGDTGPSPFVTEPKTNTTTMMPITDVNVNNDNLPNNPQYETTTTNIAANSKNNTNYTIVVVAIISSISGMLLIQLVIIAIWKRCCIKRNPSGTPQLPTNQPNPGPFYLNMLFRRECAQEIADIEQHEYDEIAPQVLEGS